MRYIAPPDPAWEGMVKRGVELPGLEGTYWRLLRVLNVQLVSKWILGERIRGVPVETLMDAIQMFIASCVTQVAGQTSRKLLMECGAMILRRTANIVHMDVQDIVENKKSIETLVKTRLSH